MANRSDNVGGNFFDPFIRKGLKLDTYTVNAGGAELAMEDTWPPVLFVDPGGAAIDLLLPAEANGLTYVIINTADAAEAITVKDDSDTNTIVSLAQNEAALLVCNGTVWKGLVGANT